MGRNTCQKERLGLTILAHLNGFAAHPLSDEPLIDDVNIRVWITDLDEQLVEPIQLSWLSRTEHARSSRLKNPVDRRRFLAGRVFTRRVLSNLTGIPLENLEIFSDKCGKPCLRMPTVAEDTSSPSLLRFNVSHSENLLCIALALDFEIGIDIEVVNPDLDILGISQVCLDEEDNNQVLWSLPDERSLVFYRLWTLREAFAKMQGHGVHSDHVRYTSAKPWSLESFEFSRGNKKVVGSIVIGARTDTYEPSTPSLEELTPLRRV